MSSVSDQPQSHIERVLHDIWCDVLSLHRVRVTDELEELRATKSSRMEIRRRIRDRFGYEIADSALSDEVTIATMAMTLRGDAAPKAGSSLVRLQPGRQPQPSLYCFHPLGGSLAVYSGLIAEVGRHWPVYGLQAIGLVDGRHPDRSIDAMAYRYAEEIIESGAEGPLVFLGYSMGGLIALEVARRLADTAAVEVEVVLADTDTRRHAPAEPDPLAAYRPLVEIALGLDMDISRLVGLPRDVALTVIRDNAAIQRRLPSTFSIARLRQIAEVCEANEMAASAHALRGRYPGVVHVIRASVPRPAADDTAESSSSEDVWAVDADEVQYHTVSAEHNALLAGEPLRRVAEVVLEVLTSRRVG